MSTFMSMLSAMKSIKVSLRFLSKNSNNLKKKFVKQTGILMRYENKC